MAELLRSPTWPILSAPNAATRYLYERGRVVLGSSAECQRRRYSVDHPHKSRDSPTKKCSRPDCDKALRARGLCAAHYSGAYQTRKYIEVECPTCGISTAKADRGKATRRFCSLICRDLWRVDQPDDPMWSFGAKRRTRGPRVCPLPKDHPARWYGKFTPISFTSCAICESPLCSPTSNLKAYCSQKCRSRAKYLRQLEAGRTGHGCAPPRAKISKAKRATIYARDAFTCWLCGDQTSLVWSQSDPLAPVLDHVLPRSRGGDDSIENLATAHASCNAERGATDVVTFPAAA